MKIYAVSTGGSEYYHVVAYFSTPELQDIYLEKYLELDEYAYKETLPLDPEPPVPETYWTLDVGATGEVVYGPFLRKYNPTVASPLGIKGYYWDEEGLNLLMYLNIEAESKEKAVSLAKGICSRVEAANIWGDRDATRELLSE